MVRGPWPGAVSCTVFRPFDIARTLPEVLLGRCSTCHLFNLEAGITIPTLPAHKGPNVPHALSLRPCKCKCERMRWNAACRLNLEEMQGPACTCVTRQRHRVSKLSIASSTTTTISTTKFIWTLYATRNMPNNHAILSKGPEELRKELKIWEFDFAKSNGRKPGRDDIKKNAAIGVLLQDRYGLGYGRLMCP